MFLVLADTWQRITTLHYTQYTLNMTHQTSRQKMLRRRADRLTWTRKGFRRWSDCMRSGGCENATKGDCHIEFNLSRITRNACAQMLHSRCFVVTTFIQSWTIRRAVRTSMLLKESGRICGRSCVLPLQLALRSEGISLSVCTVRCTRWIRRRRTRCWTCAVASRSVVAEWINAREAEFIIEFARQVTSRLMPFAWKTYAISVLLVIVSRRQDKFQGFRTAVYEVYRSLKLS